ncbi:DUF6292 family protein [Nocardiopsis sp. NRRL B-16309]|uniref:DUF6292 family protein n=1 Tax=Nocardiopsis sp. NRRL B-16309 TaxID=1519494 RepID=UPI0006AE78AD|nr:DUF6292 family protein [Nocardiopsis sp. NRRL B-16309]KOX13686.1 hypothetical protein ADL05_18550 [Nocardiopsis sp. NRRL B-16309]
MTARTDHSHYTAAVHQALNEAGHTPDSVIAIHENTGLRRSQFRLRALRVLWEEEKGWSATQESGGGNRWWCPHPVVAPPEHVAQWVSDVLAGDRAAQGVERTEMVSPDLEAALTSYNAPAWRADPDPETDPAWT